MKNKFILMLILALSITLINCSGGSSGSNSINDSIATGDLIVAEPTDPIDTTGDSGLTGNENITVVEGNIIVNVVNGLIILDGDNVQLATQLEDGSWILIEGLLIVLEDNNGTLIPGSIFIDPITGVITFVPDSPLSSSITYTIIVTIGDEIYESTVIVAVADPRFEDVTMLSSGTYNGTDYLQGDTIILGWEFGDPFTIRLTNIDDGAIVYLTAYGTYDGDGYENQVFYQRWVADNSIVENYIWNGNSIYINAEDSTLDSEANDYSFKRTYIELRIMKGIEDITKTSTVKIMID